MTAPGPLGPGEGIWDAWVGSMCSRGPSEVGHRDEEAGRSGNAREDSAVLAGFDDGGGGPGARQGAQLPEVGQTGNRILPYTFREGCSPDDSWALAEWHPRPTSDLQS